MKCSRCGHEAERAAFKNLSCRSSGAGGGVDLRCPNCQEVVVYTALDDREDAEAYVREQCRELDRALKDQDFMHATKLRYRLIDLKETLGGLDGLDKFLDYAHDKIAEGRKKAKEKESAKPQQ
ncbi:MAG: hypothetical protein SVY53_10290 [Chloroflexota bacterium]|nr:hypothetical protein [Chloroflexota bacterium]